MCGGGGWREGCLGEEDVCGVVTKVIGHFMHVHNLGDTTAPGLAACAGKHTDASNPCNSTLCHRMLFLAFAHCSTARVLFFCGRACRWGQGHCRFADGTVYEGEWVRDKRQGKGHLTRPDGSSFEGHWQDDKLEGLGES